MLCKNKMGALVPRFHWNARPQCSFFIQGIFEICLMDNERSIRTRRVPHNRLFNGSI